MANGLSPRTSMSTRFNDAVSRLPSRNFLAASLLITLLGAAVRLSNLGHDSLWMDEILTRHRVVQGADAAIAALDARDHLPLLYSLVELVLRILPEHEVTLRLPSAITGILSIPLLIAFGHAVRLPRPGLWAAMLLAIIPFHLRYSQEARHYAMLLFFSLLSLYWLYRALAQNRQREWLFFALVTGVNLLTHYSAWLLLAAEGSLIVIWAIAAVRRRGLQTLLPLSVAMLVLGLVLLFLLPRALATLQANAGPDAAMGTTAAASLATWLREIWLALGFGKPLPAILMVTGAAIGLGYLFYTRHWLLVTLLILTAVVPTALIQLLQVSRWALPKYVIYLLPGYLLCCGIALQLLVEGMAYRLPWPSDPRARQGSLALLLAAILLILAWSPLQREYDYMLRDWRSAAAGLGRAATGDDIVVALAVDTANGYNVGGVVAPYYLDRAYRVLDGNHLSLDAAEALEGREGRVTALVLNANGAVKPLDSFWQVMPYANGLYAMLPAEQTTDVLVQLTSLYESVIPFATVPSPRCALQGKLAMLRLAQGQFESARDTLAAVDPACPLGASERARLQVMIGQGLLTRALKEGNDEGVVELAAELLQSNPRDELALAALAQANLLEMFLSGTVVVADNLAPEPLSVRRFTMPHNGDSGDVLFMHPPAAASFNLQLPPEAVSLHTRLALAPESWEWGGDGATFVVRLQPEGGEEQEIFRRHIDNSTAEQNWHPVDISLAEFAGQTVTITLATENGPAGDGTGDWAGWERPLLLRERL